MDMAVENGRFVGVVGSRGKADSVSDYVFLDRGTVLLQKHSINGKFRLALLGRVDLQLDLAIPLTMVSSATRTLIHSSGKNKKKEKMPLGKLVLFLNAQVDTKREGLEKFTFKFHRAHFSRFCDVFQKAMTDTMGMQVKDEAVMMSKVKVKDTPSALEELVAATTGLAFKKVGAVKKDTAEKSALAKETGATTKRADVTKGTAKAAPSAAKTTESTRKSSRLAKRAAFECSSGESDEDSYRGPIVFYNSSDDEDTESD
jgi:hypothetical protein